MIYILSSAFLRYKHLECICDYEYWIITPTNRQEQQAECKCTIGLQYDRPVMLQYGDRYKPNLMI